MNYGTHLFSRYVDTAAADSVHLPKICSRPFSNARSHPTDSWDDHGTWLSMRRCRIEIKSVQKRLARFKLTTRVDEDGACYSLNDVDEESVLLQKYVS